MNTEIEKQLRDILFQIGKDIKIHKVDNDNMIIEIDYDKYVNEIIKLFQDLTQ
jgi:hypothetical protein